MINYTFKFLDKIYLYWHSKLSIRKAIEKIGCLKMNEINKLIQKDYLNNE